MNTKNHVNYSNKTLLRIAKLTNFSQQEKDDLVKTLSLSDNDLRKYNTSNANTSFSEDSIEYHDYYDNKINEELETSKENELGPRPSVLFEETKQKEYLIKMFFTLKKRHPNYEAEKKNYSPEQLDIVNKIEKESWWKVKCIVDTNFLKAFWKITGVDYRGAWVLWKWVIVWDPENLTRESLLRHEAIHCAQQRDIWFRRWLALSLFDSKFKQFFWPERWTASAIDYWTDNQATDLETYINQFNPEYLPNRKKNDHRKYYNKEFLKNEYKSSRENELDEIKKQLSLLESKWDDLSFEDKDKIRILKDNIKQFNRVLNHLEDDSEIRTVLIEPDVLPSKLDKTNKDYNEKAQVWTESITNFEKRRDLEKNLYSNILKKLKEKQNTLKAFSWNKEEKEFLEWEIQAYAIFLNRIKGNKDKSRSKMKNDRKILLEKRKELENKEKDIV